MAEVAQEYGVGVIPPEAVYKAEMDVYAPCALGATVTAHTLPQLKCDIIAGVANNQLADEECDGQAVMERNLLYAPDFVTNAGGLINCYTELEGYDRKRAMARTEQIHDRFLEILRKAEAEHIPTYLVANRMAEQRIEAIGRLRLTA